VYIAYELVDATTLAAHLDAGPLDPRFRRQIARDLASGVAELHRAGILHRDLKPANVLIDRDGVAKITDLGIACEVADRVRRTQAGCVMGTPDYIAPEQVQGEPVSTATDVYQLGCVFYAMLAGSPPFASGSPLATLTAQVKAPPAPPPCADPDDEPFCAVTMRALAKAPAARPTLPELLAVLPESGAASGGSVQVLADARATRSARPEWRDGRGAGGSRSQRLTTGTPAAFEHQTGAWGIRVPRGGVPCWKNGMWWPRRSKDMRRRCSRP
jgi:serine/threonine-protein kinase